VFYKAVFGNGKSGEKRKSREQVFYKAVFGNGKSGEKICPFAEDL
jgi:hypothetical protein